MDLPTDTMMTMMMMRKLKKMRKLMGEYEIYIIAPNYIINHIKSTISNSI
jgi:hypothetical protein